jgi:hypothetical protein
VSNAASGDSKSIDAFDIALQHAPGKNPGRIARPGLFESMTGM